MKTTGVITLTEAIDILDAPGRFSITITTADRKKGTGGRLITYPEAQRLEMAAMPDNVLRMNRMSPHLKRNPNHPDNKTRNIYIPRTREIVKLHIKLINVLNEKKVIL